MKKILLSIILVNTLFGCTKESSNLNISEEINNITKNSNHLNTSGITINQRSTAEQIISIFEHSTTNFNYGYTEFLDYDKGERGLTVGRIFVTGTNEDEFSAEEGYHAYDVIETYKNLGGTNKKIINIAKTKYISFNKKLKDIKEQWETMGEDEIFKNAQDEIFYKIAYKPAIDKMHELGAKLPLTLLALLDAYVLQGEGGEDGVLQMIEDLDTYTYRWKRSKTKFSNLEEEKEWLENFLYTRDYIISQEEYSYGNSKFRIYTILNLFYDEEYYLDINNIDILYSSDNSNDADENFKIDQNHPRKKYYSK